MIEKVKRTLNLGAKTCLVCGESFQPASGAQRTCSPECKEKAKAQGLTKRGHRKRCGVDPVLVEETAPDRVHEPFQATPAVIPVAKTPTEASSNGVAEDELPDIEVDLEPLAKWVRAVVRQAMKSQVKDLVDEAIRDRLRGLLAK